LNDRFYFWPAALFFAVLAALFFQIELARRFKDPFPPISASLSSPKTQLNDFAGICFGTRRLAADIAWIQTLQYYGTPEAGQSEHDFENGIGKYPDFLAYCQRVLKIDPYFSYVYYYGGGALGWNLNRLDEAEELLKEGVSSLPQEWRLQQYLAALAYQKNHDPAKLVKFLESFANDPNCPNLLRSILANIYKKQKRYRDALRLWLMIYDTHDPAYRDRALNQIQELKPLGFPA